MRFTAGSISRCYRRGLAPLELVLALPILLMLMALMVNFGVIASWKVRALCIARHSAWGNRSPRSTANFPRPAGWPTTASSSIAGLPPAAELDGPRTSLPPLGPPGALDPNTEVMEPTLGLIEGRAGMVRQFPMLGTLGQFHLDAQTELLDNSWDFQRMGLGANTAFRIPTIYILPPAPEQEDWVSDYRYARKQILALIFAPSDPRTLEPPIWPLDREVDFAKYGLVIQRALPERHWSLASPDFHPSLRLCSYPPICFCGSDQPEDVINELVERRIPELPENMTRRFINLYESAIQAYETLLAAEPPPSPAQIAAMKAEIDQLQKKIDALNQFLQKLQN